LKRVREKITVPITGSVSPGIAETIYSLRKSPENVDVRIVTCDMRDNVVGKYLADAFYVVPQAQDSGFINAVLEICEKEDVDVILPQVTSDKRVECLCKVQGNIKIARGEGCSF